MAKILEWVEVPFEEQFEPEPEPKCPTGVNSHKWIMSIEEGSVYLSLAEGEECPKWERMKGLGERSVCELFLSDLQPEDFFGGTLWPVSLKWTVEHGYFSDDVYCYATIEAREE